MYKYIKLVNLQVFLILNALPNLLVILVKHCKLRVCVQYFGTLVSNLLLRK